MNTKPTRNASGCLDLTAFHAIRNADREIAGANSKKYPSTYICSPFRGDIERNTANAVRYSRFALEQGRFPIAPHLFLPRFLDDADAAERALALSFGIRLLCGCREVWVFGSDISSGMAAEIAEAKRRKIKVRYFNENCEEAC